MQRIIYWLGIAACVVLVAACFMPWTYHADLGKDFTGFFSEQNRYGKPGRFLSFFAILILICTLLPKLWAKRLNLFLGAVLIAYAIKTYILYTSCYMAYCPEKKTGVFLMIFSSAVIFVATAFPNMKLPAEKKD